MCACEFCDDTCTWLKVKQKWDICKLWAAWYFYYWMINLRPSLRMHHLNGLICSWMKWGDAYKHTRVLLRCTQPLYFQALGITFLLFYAVDGRRCLNTAFPPLLLTLECSKVKTEISCAFMWVWSWSSSFCYFWYITSSWWTLMTFEL